MSKISWDKYSLKIDGKRKFLLSGEFHYWRIPDRERWRDILKMYKIAGLNTIRIYFSWGYHSPSEGVYYFSGNRDVEYLLNLCEELGFYVLIAAGPYICAETSAGGYPSWLLTKREIRIKHLKRTAKTKYDPKYMKYCEEWFEKFIAEIKSYQITINSNRCIIGFQIENEYFEKLYIFRGSRKYMEELIKISREFGITVPTFHNDNWEKGSWNGLVDLHGFDKYPILAPKNPKKIPIPKWSFKYVFKKVDNLEKRIRSFGDAIAESPIFIPELQGGWYCPWGENYGYDDLYDFYGSPYQKMILQSMTAQGSTMMNLYMFYGGTTWGAVANPEVYTSYDYSACIREFGYQSDRLRHVRLFNLFVQSFNNSLTNTDSIKNSRITCSEKNILSGQRRGIDKTEFYFLRNFNKKGRQSFIINLFQGKKKTITGTHELDTRDSYIIVANHEFDGFFILLCSLPIILKGNYASGTLLVVILNQGELLIKGTDLNTIGDVNVVKDDNFTRFSFASESFCCITNSDGKKLYVVCLSKENALTLNADFSNSEVQLAWGVYSIYFKNIKELEIETLGLQTLWMLSSISKLEGLKFVDNSAIPGLMRSKFGSIVKFPEIYLQEWYQCKTNWGNKLEIWKEIDFKKENDPLDHNFTSGHILYKCEFDVFEEKSLKIKLNIRHKVAIWLNNKFIGGHATYNSKNLKAGAVNGPDPKFLSSKKYDLSGALKSSKNILYIVTESLGQNSVTFILNDGRNPRGILSAKFSKKLISEKWYISGVDITKLEQPYNTAGLPGEKFSYQIGEGDKWNKINGLPTISPEDQIIWYKTKFNWQIDENKRIPLRIHLEGKHNVNIFLNGIFIGRYWGSFGPQHDFYLMDQLLKEENILVLACWTTENDNFSISIEPYRIKIDSGNIDEKGIEFATLKYKIKL